MDGPHPGVRAAIAKYETDLRDADTLLDKLTDKMSQAISDAAVAMLIYGADSADAHILRWARTYQKFQWMENARVMLSSRLQYLMLNGYTWDDPGLSVREVEDAIELWFEENGYSRPDAPNLPEPSVVDARAMFQHAIQTLPGAMASWQAGLQRAASARRAERQSGPPGGF